MESEKIQQISDMLLSEESVENNMIEIYKSLLDLGAENCVSADQMEDFKKGVSILYEDSLMHKAAIQAIRNKYTQK